MTLDDAPSFRPYHVSNEPPTYCTFEEGTKNVKQFEWTNVDPAKCLGEYSTNYFCFPFFWLHLNELSQYHVSNAPLIYCTFKGRTTSDMQFERRIVDLNFF
jgi:hypothetical protein